MIKFDDKKLVIHQELNREEAIIFCKFLIAEIMRHEEDIGMIKETIKYLEKKHSFEIENKME